MEQKVDTNVFPFRSKSPKGKNTFYTLLQFSGSVRSGVLVQNSLSGSVLFLTCLSRLRRSSSEADGDVISFAGVWSETRIFGLTVLRDGGTIALGIMVHPECQNQVLMANPCGSVKVGSV